MQRVIKIFIILIIYSLGKTNSQSLLNNNENVNLHFQETVITQGHPGFQAKYSGNNSLNTHSESATSITTTLYFGLRIVNNLELYADPEISGGSGISGAVGLAGFSNGETFRIGNPKPTLYPARLFLKYTFNFNDNETEIADDENQLSEKQSNENFSIILGKFGIADYFDNNDYSHDPRTQFLNWSLMNSGAWDYPADTRGYTWGLVCIYNNPNYVIQFAGVMEPLNANGLEMDTHINKAYSLTLEFDKAYSIANNEGDARILFFLNKARMGNYRETINNPAYNMDISQSRRYSRNKIGFAFNLSQKINKSTGGFLRLSWNDGKNETWAFTEIDHSLALGLVQEGIIKSRVNDELGIAYILNGISADHRDYLASGGYGFIIGDGKLNYDNENIFELYYKIQISDYLAFTPDYQFVINPAYNKDRGPVNIFSIRTRFNL